MARRSVPSTKGAVGLLRTVERLGLRKGVAGSKGFFYVGTGLWTLRTIRRIAERNTEILVSERLEPGQRIVIANGRATVEQDPAAPILTTGRAKKLKKQAKKSEKQAKKTAKRAKRRSG